MRARQKLPVCSAFPAVMVQLVTDENGSSVFRTQDLSLLKLPDPEVTDLALQLKAGVDIRRVNTKIVGSDSVVTDLSAQFEEKQEIEEKGE